MSEPRCDAHGPYTAEEAALFVLGDWKPEPTGYICAPCREAISAQAKVLADTIDAAAFEYVMRQTRDSA